MDITAEVFAEPTLVPLLPADLLGGASRLKWVAGSHPTASQGGIAGHVRPHTHLSVGSSGPVCQGPIWSKYSGRAVDFGGLALQGP